MQFFAFLTLAKTVSVASFLELLQSFLVVLDEPGVSYERMEAAALCVGEGLIRVCTHFLFLWAICNASIHFLCSLSGWWPAIQL